jgi:predicted aconitase with swiveling domain
MAYDNARSIILKGRKVVGGLGSGEALVSCQPISFLGGVDPKTGEIVEKNHNLYGKNVAGRVLVFPGGKGSTVGSYIIYALKKYGTNPTAMVNVLTEPIIATGCVIAEIPLIDRLDNDPTKIIETGDYVIVDATNGQVDVKKKNK